MSESATTPDHSGSGRAWSFTTGENLRRVFERSETILFLVSSNLRAGHRDKLLGNLWNLLDPAFFLAVYYLVFGIGLRQASPDPEAFVLYMSLGILVFHYFESCLAQAATAIRAHAGIIHEAYFPKAVLPISLCLSRLYDFLWGMLVLTAVMALLGAPFGPQLLWLPALVALQIILSLGLAFIVGHLGAFYADTANIVAVTMRLLFFASPIFYFASDEGAFTGIVPAEYLELYRLNPLTPLLDGFRDVMIWGRAPDLAGLGYVAAVALTFLLIGFSAFSRGEGQFAKYL